MEGASRLKFDPYRFIAGRNLSSTRTLSVHLHTALAAVLVQAHLTGAAEAVRSILTAPYMLLLFLNILRGILFTSLDKCLNGSCEEFLAVIDQVKFPH